MFKHSKNIVPKSSTETALKTLKCYTTALVGEFTTSVMFSPYFRCSVRCQKNFFYPLKQQNWPLGLHNIAKHLCRFRLIFVTRAHVATDPAWAMPMRNLDPSHTADFRIRAYNIRYDTVYLICSKKLTDG